MVELKEVAPKKDKAVFAQISDYNHEQIVFCHDKETGLKAIIGIHNTVLGPALGGTRMWSYASEAEALDDVLRLSRGMTYKAAISGLNLGGGKAVIIGDAKKDKSEALLRKFGRFIKNLNGAYITAEDVGMTTKDMEYIRMETEHVSGLPESMGGGGDPSPVTAYGTYMGMKAAAKKAFGTDALSGKKVSVQGVGHVGGYLVELLAKENAEVYITDIYEDRLREVSNKYGAKVVSMDEIYDLDVDIYSPCALGGTINDNTINRLKCQVIAGCANNQLRDENVHGPALVEKGIVYAPDFLINAGGLINVYSELVGYNRDNAYAQTERIYGYTLDIFNLAEKEGIHNQLAAMRMAEQRIQSIGKVRSTY
ncbi:leucine dehydrogenase [Pontibacter ummariensis]|uniref:Leucine dehydrogenase n=1 Tax=Pontibacter ummariensis TaxID=1610492 RepID=A0A239GUB6_9BACT|nr:Glu/Leu/Phe/Val dehydrogenase dimerization domain-containing protein [Pontibacter ummariensis]PRY11030.1 leucine dehydrogenase [Pontibacter ummariensis]SNS72475.1 leucine dehydrogenase [Pontibacter ummariensis]